MGRSAHVVAEGIYFGEGPRWHDGKLWFSDFHAHAIKALSPEAGSVAVVLAVDGQPSGLGWLPDGRLLFVSMLDRRLMRVEGDGSIVEHADLSGIATFHCNDMVVDGQGRAYVGNFGFDLEAYVEDHGFASAVSEAPRAAVALVPPEGGPGSARVAADGFQFPNGTVLTPDGRTLVIAESLGLRLTAFDVDVATGELSNRRVWAQLDRVVPDGICLDADGAVWVANALAPEAVRVLEGGEIADRVDCSQNVYACMLGGEERTTLYCVTAPTSATETASVEALGRIEAAEVEVPGAGWP